MQGLMDFNSGYSYCSTTVNALSSIIRLEVSKYCSRWYISKDFGGRIILFIAFGGC